MEAKHETYLNWYIRKMQESKEILATTSYMLWLENFTKLHAKFTDATWLHSQEEINEKDYDNVIKLDSLFVALERYADANYITSNSDEFGVYYTITFNGVPYKVGVMAGQGTIFYCERLKTCSSSINFDDISQNKPAPNTQQIDAIFCDIFDAIRHLNSEFSLPFTTISDKISEFITDR